MVYAVLRHMLTACVLITLGAFASEAQIPRTISYQGALYESGGGPLPDGSYRITFQLYDAVDAASPVWSETHDAVVTRGVFTVYLGSIEPLDLDFSKPYWVGVQRDGEPELSPRLPFTAAPYAFIAERSLTADVADRAQTATTADRATVADSAASAGTATTATTAETATTAQTAVSAQTAVVADTARFVDGDFVTSVNDASGAITIKGAGATLVTTNGNEVTISSIDGEEVSAVLYAPDGTQQDLTDGTTFLFDVGYGDLTTSASGARITSRAGGEQGSATALTLIAEPTDSAEGIALMAQGFIETDSAYRIGGEDALKFTRRDDTLSIGIGPGALGWERDQRFGGASRNIAIGRSAMDSAWTSRNVVIGNNAGRSLLGSGQNVIIGHEAASGGTYNVGSVVLPRQAIAQAVILGAQAGDSVDRANGAVMIGFHAGRNADSISASVLVGWQAGLNSDIGSSIAIGQNAGQSSHFRDGIMIGSGAGFAAYDYGSIAIGRSAGIFTRDSLNVYNNIYLGNSVRPRVSEAGIHLVLIGEGASAVGDVIQNAVAIGHDAVVTSSGSISLGAYQFGGGHKVGIATPSPTRFLDVNGDARIGRKGTTIKDIILLDSDEQPGGRIQSGQQRRLDIAVDGATVGASVTATPYPPLPMGVMIANAYVESADNVRVTLYNFSDDFVDMENMTFKLLVVQ